MDSKYPFLHVVSTSLPEQLSKDLAVLCSSTVSSEALLDNLIRFVCGADCSTDVDEAQWASQQALVRRKLGELLPKSSQKRPREFDGTDSVPESADSKRQKTVNSNGGDSDPISASDPPKFTLHSISVSSPIRKKVNIAIHESSVRFINPHPKPDASSVEAVVPLSSLRRAFLLPTRGKPKPHWTVVILSNDVPERSKAPVKAIAGSSLTSTAGNNPQIIFGLDAVATTPLSATSHSSSGPSETKSLSKGDETLSLLREFLANLSLPNAPIQLSVESIEKFDRFRGDEGGGDGVVERPSLALSANLAAKSGTLWFMPHGILWGESKPCQFWSTEDLLPPGSQGGEGVRTMTATGRVCTVVLTRTSDAPEGAEEEEDGQEPIGEETVFGQIEGKEQEGVNQWVRKYRNSFGVKGGASGSGTGKSEGPKKSVASNGGRGGDGGAQSSANAGPLTISQMIVDSDDEQDEDFVPPAGRGSESEEVEDDGDGSGDEDEDAEGDDVGSGEEEEDGSADEDEDELKPEHHPLLRPGAVPKMSRAAMDMVVGMVETDMVGGGQEEDELED